MENTMSQPTRSAGPWAVGVGSFAGAALVTIGVFQIIQAISALANDEVFVNTPNYVFALDLTAWGWIHLLIGALLIAVGFGVWIQQTWALVTGMALAIISAVANFAWLPYTPWWSIALIAFDIAAIWALSRLMGDGSEY